MDNQIIQQFKKSLEDKKIKIEEELKSFTEEDKELKGDYDTIYPNEPSSQSKDEEATEVEVYENALPVEHTLELDLQDINIALAKIEGNNYGICDNCHQPIEIDRLKIFPEAKTCVKCD